MKQQVRLCVFETNSSSTHSITIVDKEDYNKWENGELWLRNDRWKEVKEFLSVDEAIEKNIEHLKQNYDDITDELIANYKRTKNLDEAIADCEECDIDYGDIDKDELYLSFQEYMDGVVDYYESYTEEYTTKNGDKIVAFGYYGQDY